MTTTAARTVIPTDAGALRTLVHAPASPTPHAPLWCWSTAPGGRMRRLDVFVPRQEIWQRG